MRNLFLAAALVTVAAASLTGCGIHSVDTGHYGIKTHFGKVEDGPYPAGGPYFTNPFTESFSQIDIQTQKETSKEQSYTKDAQTATVEFTLNYNLLPDAVAQTFATAGVDWADKLIPQVVQNDLKDEVAKWNAVDFLANRQQATNNVAQQVGKDLASKGINLSGFFITDIGFSPAFDRAVESKVIANQRAQQAQNDTARIQQEAQQRVIQATAEAQAMRVRADALEANPKLVEWEAVQKWDGHLPQYQLGGATPFISVPSK